MSHPGSVDIIDFVLLTIYPVGGLFIIEILSRIIELERKDQREISIRPHPHEFYLYFDV